MPGPHTDRLLRVTLPGVATLDPRSAPALANLDPVALLDLTLQNERELGPDEPAC